LPIYTQNEKFQKLLFCSDKCRDTGRNEYCISYDIRLAAPKIKGDFEFAKYFLGGLIPLK
jgi:hypothetical protein